MSEVKHAPGPWAFKEGRAERHEMSTIFKANDPEFLIGYVLCDARNPHQRPEDIANARLMAAAPELLEALKAVREANEINLNKGNTGIDPTVYESAIAKAETT